jgi:hypothetical protein
MSALYLLATGAAFQSRKPLCAICTSDVRRFFYILIEALVEMKDEYICIRRNITELRCVSWDYNAVGLPGCVGSMDVVHVNWANCPTGDHNCVKGKRGIQPLHFSVSPILIAGFWQSMDRGSCNDKDIVKHDDNVRAIRFSQLFTNTTWKYYDANCSIKSEQGMYLICDNGYLRWPTLICSHSGMDNSTVKGYFSTNLESVQKMSNVLLAF